MNLRYGIRTLTHLRPGPACIWLLLLLLSATPTTTSRLRAGDADEQADCEEPDTVLLREIYVPYDVFHKLQVDRPEGIVMELTEYRKLVLAAEEATRPGAPARLPPVEAVVLAADYRGRVSHLGDNARTARFTARLSVQVAREGWVLCDLGTPPTTLGSVTVDGQPGWLIVGDATDAASAARKSRKSLRHAYLLLHGVGRHEVELTFSLRVKESAEQASLSSRLFTAATASLELTVPGRAEGNSKPEVLHTRTDVDGQQTRFLLSLGSSRSFRLSWRGKKSVGENSVLLTTEHALSFLPRRDNPSWAWRARVRIARQSTDRLVFTEPQGMTVLHVQGPLLHSWQRRDASIEVLLKEAVEGEVRLAFEGVFTIEDERFLIQPPRLQGAFSDSGVLGLATPAGHDVEVTSTLELEEIALDEAQVPAPGSRAPLARLFRFRSAAASLNGRIQDAGTAFETRVAHLLHVNPRRATLRSRFQVEVSEGNVYRLDLNLPTPWQLVALNEIPGDTPLGLSYEEVDGDETRLAYLALERAATPSRPFEVIAQFENTAFSEDRDWNRRRLDFALPTLRGARRSESLLGLALTSSLDLVETNLPRWRSLSAEESRELGLVEVGGSLQASRPGAPRGRVVAGLTTQASEPSVDVVVSHRGARGEYRAVTHVLAAESQLRVRTDLRLAVVDRGVESLTFRLPVLPVELPVIIQGDGIKERTQENATGLHTVRFDRPWLGTRQFRIEYEVPHLHEQATPITDVRLEGNFGGERFLVLQSRGAVEVESAPDAGLTTIDWDDIPDFATAWKDGRVLRVFRFRERGDPGTLRTLLHDNAPVLSRLARRMVLTTVIGAEGTSRTQAEILLAYARSQYLTVELPGGARVLAAQVGGEPVRAVRTEPDLADKAVFSIPLPPQSYANVTLVYEEQAQRGGGRREELGGWGRLTETGPVLRGIPIGETKWRVYHPEGYRFDVTGGNLRAERAVVEGRARGFAAAFFGTLRGGRWPALTVLREEHPLRPRAAVPALSAAELRGAHSPTEDHQATTSNRLMPQQSLSLAHAQSATASSTLSQHPRAPLYRVLPQGRVIEATKIGGTPQLQLSYQSFALWNSAKKTVFLLTLCAGFILHLRRGRRAFLRFTLGGLFLGTLLPLATSWESPLLLVPFCEGLVVLLVLALALWLWRLASRSLARSRGAALRPAASVLALTVLLAGATQASEALLVRASEEGALHQETDTDCASPFDVVWIPYDRDGLPTSDENAKAYLSGERFRELWKLAYPEQAEPRALPCAFALGHANYELEVAGDTYRLRGRIPLHVFTDEWVTITLPFDNARAESIKLDGLEQGVSQRDGLPFLELRGVGLHEIEVTLTGEVKTDRGRFRIQSRVLKGAAATVRLNLPENASVQTKGRRPGAMLEARSPRTVGVLDLGHEDLHVEWLFPQKSGQQGSQVESLAYSALLLNVDGIDIARRELLKVTGHPVDRIEYRIFGGWEVADVRGTELSEWTVTEDPEQPESRLLKVFFARPVDQVSLGIYGRALLGDRGPLPGLALRDAARAENFVGLYHGGGRRFLPDVLEGMQRASFKNVTATFSLPVEEVPDRVYHAYATGENEELAAAAQSVEYDLQTDAVVLVRSDRLLSFVRARFTKATPGPLRYEVTLPPGWVVRKVTADTLHSWDVTTTGGETRLVAQLNERARTDTEITWAAEQLYSTLPEEITIPFVATPRGARSRGEESVHVTLAAESQLELTTVRAPRWEPLALEQAPAWVELPAGSSPRLAYRSKRTDAVLAVSPRPRPSDVSATIVSFARVSEEALHVNARVVLRTRHGGEDHFRLRLPAAAEVESLETTNQQSRNIQATDDSVTIDVHLQSPVTSEHTMDLTYRLPRAGTGIPALSAVVVEQGSGSDVQADTYLGVVQTARTFTLELEPRNLVRLELDAMPYLPQGVSRQSLIGSYRATRTAWTLNLVEREIEIATSFDAVLELADLVTLLGTDGTTRTRVTYTLRKEGLQFLGVHLPAGAELWGVTVNGKGVAVARETASSPDTGLALRIPVDEAGKTDLPVEVRLYYEEEARKLPVIRGTVRLEAPRLLEGQSVRVMKTLWSVQLPDGYWVSESGGNMRQVPTSLKHAEKVKQLLERKKKVLSVVKGADSRRVRERAARDLARLEQSLGDNLAELEGSNRSQEEASQKAQIGQLDLRQQWLANDQLIMDAQGAQLELRKEREIQAQSSEQSADEQAFEDRTNFRRGRAWNEGKKAHKALPQRPAPGIQSKLASLLESHSFDGCRGLGGDVALDDVEFTQARSIDKSALDPLPDATRRSTAISLDAPEPRKGDVTYTFRHMQGAATLEISLTRQTAVPRLAAAAALLCAALALLARRFKG